MTQSVRSADRTLAIFEAFERAQGELTLGELSEMCDTPLSTCHSLVQTLLKRGYLYSIGKRKTLYPTGRLLKLAKTVATHDPFISRVAHILEALADQTGETITLGKRQGDQVLYVDAIDGTQAIRYAAHPGEYRPLHATALGKALLSDMQPEEFQAWLSKQRFEKMSPNTIVSKMKLSAEVIEGRERGYFTANGELVNDLSSIAVLLKRSMEPLALSITGPTQRMQPLLKDFGQHLMATKRKIEMLDEG